MKTKLLIAFIAAVLLAFSQPAWAAPATFESRQKVRQNHRPAALSKRETSGVLPRAIRGGNPLQMVNPFAPAKYGAANQSVSIDPDVAGRVNGINLVSISF
jgi:hypothetical protein